MLHAMKMLGIRSAEEWAGIAWSRAADTDEQACLERRLASEQMLAMMSAAGFVPDASFLEDVELLISGRMSFDEHRAYLMEKYKEQA